MGESDTVPAEEILDLPEPPDPCRFYRRALLAALATILMLLTVTLAMQGRG